MAHHPPTVESLRIVMFASGHPPSVLAPGGGAVTSPRAWRDAYCVGTRTKCVTLVARRCELLRSSAATRLPLAQSTAGGAASPTSRSASGRWTSSTRTWSSSMTRAVSRSACGTGAAAIRSPTRRVGPASAPMDPRMPQRPAGCPLVLSPKNTVEEKVQRFGCCMDAARFRHRPRSARRSARHRLLSHRRGAANRAQPATARVSGQRHGARSRRCGWSGRTSPPRRLGRRSR